MNPSTKFSHPFVAIAMAIGVGSFSACATAPAQTPSEPPVATAREAAATRAEPSGPGTLPSAPLARGEVVKLEGFQVEVTDFARGPGAWTALQAASKANTQAEQGWEFALVRLKVTGLAASSWVGCEDFRVIGTRRVAYFHGPQTPPAPTLPNKPLEAGQTAEGWCAYPIDAADRSLILMIDVRHSPEALEFRYVALEPSASLPAIPRAAETAKEKVGESPQTAAIPGREVVTPDWSVTVLRVLRGEAAERLVKDANAKIEPPAEGLEFVAVELHAQYHGSAEEPRLISPQQFSVIGPDGKPYARPIVVDLKPSLSRTLLPSGEHTGWAVFQVAPGDERAVLRFEPYYPERAIRYFALSGDSSLASSDPTRARSAK